MKAKRERFGQYVVIDWNKENDEENVKNIAGAIRELLKAARKSEYSMIENSIYIVVKGAEKINTDEFGCERHYIGSDQMTVGLCYDGLKWEKENGRRI